MSNEPDALDALYKAAVVRGDTVEAEKVERALEELPRALERVITPTTHQAVWYASHGWPVFPLKTWKKMPSIRNPHELGSRERAECKGECGKLGHGLYDATTATGVAQEMFEKLLAPNIGIATGHQMDVFDIDPGGHETLAGWLAEDPGFPPLLGIAVTPRRGYHLWVPPTGRGNTADIGPGVDYRGVGGYVVAPPSYVDDDKSKGSYRWLLPPMLPPTAGG
jgi:hypothetical protein